MLNTIFAFIGYGLLDIKNTPGNDVIDIAYFLAIVLLVFGTYLSYKSYKNKHMDSRKIPLLVITTLSVPAFILGVHLGILILWDVSLCTFLISIFKLDNGIVKYAKYEVWFVTSVVALFVSIYAFVKDYELLGLLFAILFVATIGMYAIFCVAQEVGNVIRIIIRILITPDAIRQEIRFKCPEAMKIEILKEKRNYLECGIRNKNNKKIAKATIESDAGIADSVYVGQVITV